ncbi:MAG: DUF488 domain-containing protein [Bacteroidales bacterium]|nr:DUF488 domain-containing protein [Bacteroidales bacterium]
MKYYRRKILMAVLQCFGGSLSAIELQKYLFLFTRKQEENKAFDFIPYKYGCYSYQAQWDISALKTKGYLTENDNIISISQKDNYLALLDLFDQSYLRQLKSDFEGYSKEDVIRYTYQKFPYYATKSTIAQDVLKDCPEYLTKIESQKRHLSEPQLFTIGYEGISLETYLNKLIINDVHTLCDVRKNAYSQKYGFTKAQLQKECEGVGIRYVHVPQLGIESEKRQELNTQADYDRLFDEYEKTTLKDNFEALQYVRNLIKTDQRVALTCFEKDPKQCHRSRVAKALMQFDDRDYELKLL